MSFIEAAKEHGLILDHVIADGRVHRVPTLDHPRKKNGAYLFDGRTGFFQNWAQDGSAVAYRNGEESEAPAIDIQQLRRARDAERVRNENKARKRAIELIESADLSSHPYLSAKGFPNELMYVKDDTLLVPMWDVRDYGKRLNSVQEISVEGRKKFLFGGRAKESVFKLGSGREIWHCEGLATGLSIRDALKSVYRQATVVVSFSAGNLARVAKALGGVIVADNDASGTGKRIARESRLPWWMPPDVGMDANDFHQRYGLRNLAVMLIKTRVPHE